MRNAGYVYGQGRAKRDLAVGVYNHYLSQAVRDVDGEDLGRNHILLIGPTGTGKSYLVRTLAEWLGVPVGFASATTLAEVRYKGDSVDSLIKGLLERAGGDPKKAEKGIVFLETERGTCLQGSAIPGVGARRRFAGWWRRRAKKWDGERRVAAPASGGRLLRRRTRRARLWFCG